MCLVQAHEVMPDEKRKTQGEECGRALEKRSATSNNFAKEASMRSQEQILSLDKRPFICVIRRRTALQFPHLLIPFTEFYKFLAIIFN
jgi:hypothetical protein